MPDCSGCKHWTLRRRRLYEDGTENVYFQVIGGNGLCEILKTETAPAFGCNSHEAAPGYDHVQTDNVAGAPWQNFKMGRCPDCQGRGSGLEGGACRRCTGTGQVRYYDDGYIGEERTRRHPKEPDVAPVADPGMIVKPMPRPNVL